MLSPLELLYTLAVHLGDVKRALSVLRHQVRQLENFTIAPLFRDRAVFKRKVNDTVGVAIGNQQLLADYDQAERVAEAGPHADPLSVQREHLNSIVAAISNVNAVLLVDRNTVRGGEFPRRRAFPAPF